MSESIYATIVMAFISFVIAYVRYRIHCTPSISDSLEGSMFPIRVFRVRKIAQFTFPEQHLLHHRID